MNKTAHPPRDSEHSNVSFAESYFSGHPRYVNGCWLGLLPYETKSRATAGAAFALSSSSFSSSSSSSTTSSTYARTPKRPLPCKTPIDERKERGGQKKVQKKQVLSCMASSSSSEVVSLVSLIQVLYFFILMYI